MNNRRFFTPYNLALCIAGAFIAIIIGLAFFGCTYPPVRARASVVAYSGNDQNAGVIGFAPSGSLIITQSKADEYLALIDRYGARLVPPLTRANSGLLTHQTHETELTYELDREHVAKFRLMKLWQHRGASAFSFQVSAFSLAQVVEVPTATPKPARTDHWQFWKNEKKEWRWSHIASNGREIGASTEGYKNWKDCLDNARRHGYADKNGYVGRPQKKRSE